MSELCWWFHTLNMLGDYKCTLTSDDLLHNVEGHVGEYKSQEENKWCNCEDMYLEFKDALF